MNPEIQAVLSGESRGCVVCGDCLPIMREMPDKCVDLVLTDPPYGIGVNYGDSYNDSRDDYWQWLNVCLTEMRRIGKIVVMHHRPKAIRLLAEADWCGVWYKPMSFGSRVGNSMVLPHWEPILLYGIHSVGTLSKYSSDVFICAPEKAGNNSEIGRAKWSSESLALHPCPKPLNLEKQLINAFNENGGIIADFMGGSGTTAVSAKQLGRRFIMGEINPDYVEIANRRLAQEEIF